jgi:hypothetical protein
MATTLQKMDAYPRRKSPCVNHYQLFLSVILMILLSWVRFLTRWTFDLKKKPLCKERLENKNVKFPRVDEQLDSDVT